MEFAMRYLFWIVLLVIVLLAGGFWYLTVPGQQAEAKKLQAEIDRAAEELMVIADRAQDIKTQSHVDAAKDYAAKLVAEDKAVKALLRDKKTTIHPKLAQAPKDFLKFDEWLIGIRKGILDQAEKANMVLPTHFKQVWLDEGRITNSNADRTSRMKKISLAGEVIRLLCSVKATVPVTEFVADAEKPETPKRVQVGSASLDSLLLLKPADRYARVKDYTSHAFASSAKAPPALTKLPPVPYKASLLDVQFTAPLQVVPGLVKALETGPHWFAKVTKIDVQRATEPYSKTAISANMKTVKVGTDGKPSYVNTHYQEAPVQVQVWLELLDFDPAKLM